MCRQMLSWLWPELVLEYCPYLQITNPEIAHQEK